MCWLYTWQLRQANIPSTWPACDTAPRAMPSVLWALSTSNYFVMVRESLNSCTSSIKFPNPRYCWILTTFRLISGVSISYSFASVYSTAAMQVMCIIAKLLRHASCFWSVLSYSIFIDKFLKFSKIENWKQKNCKNVFTVVHTGIARILLTHCVSAPCNPNNPVI